MNKFKDDLAKDVWESKYRLGNETLDELLELQNRYFNHKSYKIIINLKTYILRKIRRLIEFVLQK